ncbi:hypothetical protein Gotur_008237, partial [Gossypium turneri]
LNIEREFLGKVEDNAAVRVWSEKVQQEKGDSLMKGYVSELWDFTRISVTQNNLQELKEIWDQWGDEIRQLFYSNYGDLPYLLDVKIQVDRAYSRVAYVPTFLKKLMSITGMSEQWVAARIKQKRDKKCMHWKNLRDLILAHPDVRKRVDIFALSIYGLIIFPKALGHMDEAVSDLFDRLDKRVTPSLLKSREGLLSGFLRKLLLIKGTSGYTETKRYHRGEMVGDSPKPSRGGCRVESPMDDP